MLIYVIWDNEKSHDIINMDNVTDIIRYERIIHFHYVDKRGKDYTFNTAEEAEKTMYDITSAYMKGEKVIAIVTSSITQNYSY